MDLGSWQKVFLPVTLAFPNLISYYNPLPISNMPLIWRSKF